MCVSFFVAGVSDVGVFHARDMESVEEGSNAEKDKTVGRAKDGSAGVPGGGEANADPERLRQSQNLPGAQEGWDAMWKPCVVEA